MPRANTGLSKYGDPVFPHFWSWNQNLARVCARGGEGTASLQDITQHPLTHASTTSHLVCPPVRAPQGTATALTALDAPLPLNSPVFSVATCDATGATNMNILTFASPVGVRPERRWAISLWRKTRTHALWSAQRSGVLQQLSAAHAPLTYALGGRSGADTDKAAACQALGFDWREGPPGGNERVLPGCVAYYRLRQEGDLINAGEHDVAICVVEGMWTAGGDGAAPPTALSTQALREQGLITNAGRAVVPEEEA